VDAIVPMAAASEQRSIVDEFQRIRELHTAVDSGLQASIDLLGEYKRSLITAVISGELDVTTARRGVVA
jgi:hypothetical protein